MANLIFIPRQVRHAVCLDDLKGSRRRLLPTTYRPGPAVTAHPFLLPPCLLQAPACRPIPCASASALLPFSERRQRQLMRQCLRMTRPPLRQRRNVRV